MTFHLAAYMYASPTTTTGGNPAAGALQSLNPITDQYLSSTANGFLLPSALQIVAAYATSQPYTLHGGGTNAGLQRALISAPSLLRVSYPMIRPVSRSNPEFNDPNVMNLLSNPLLLPASENVVVQAAVDTWASLATSATVYALLWFREHSAPVPQQCEKYTLRFSSTVAATANVWSPLGSLTFDQSLPQGRYMVVGLEHWSATAVAARLIFPGSYMRPGTLSLGTQSTFLASGRSERMFFEGGIGVYGVFNSFAPPSIEVLAMAADAVHEGYLTVVRTGDIGHHPEAQQHGSATPEAMANSPLVHSR